MRPFYFGSSSKPLFGLLHEAAGGAPRRGAAVLCYPFASEYTRVHRSIKELATRLAQAGFTTLRFDYYGSGDSGGDGEEARVGQWLADIDTAIEEAKESSGSDRVALIGLRLGASLAALSSSKRSDIDRLVLWEPVVSGRTYVADLLERYDQWFGTRVVGSASRGESTEAWGVPLPAELRAELEGIDLAAAEPPAIDDLLVVVNQPGPAFGALRERLVRARFEEVPSAPFWLEATGFGQPLVPHETMQLIVRWLSECGDA